MNRRGFLGLLGGRCLDPERLLWRPDQRLISIPSFVQVRPPQAFLRLLDSNSVEISGLGYARAPIGSIADVPRVAFDPCSHCCFPEAKGEWVDVAAAEVVDRNGRPVWIATSSFGQIAVRFGVTLQWSGERNPITLGAGDSLRVSFSPPWPDQPSPVTVTRRA